MVHAIMACSVLMCVLPESGLSTPNRTIHQHKSRYLKNKYSVHKRAQTTRNFVVVAVHRNIPTAGILDSCESEKTSSRLCPSNKYTPHLVIDQDPSLCPVFDCLTMHITALVLILVAANPIVHGHVYLTSPTSRVVFAWSQYQPKMCSEAKGAFVTGVQPPMYVAATLNRSV